MGERWPLTIVGAGPVGSLLSVFMAQRGFEVEVYERRADMRKETMSAGRSINLAVSTRGLHALAQIGMEQVVLKQAIPMRGRMIHPVSGPLAFQAYGKDDSQYISSISRGGLNQALMTAAEATGRVRIHFKRKVTGADFGRGELSVDGERVKAPVVFGADGSASALRQALRETKGFTETESDLDYGYKELHIPPGPGGAFLLEKNALHIWPRGTYMLIALPNLDGSFTCTLFLPFKGAPSFAELSGPREVNAFFQSQFPDAHALLPQLTGDFFANPTGHMVTVKCFPWNAGRALLLGDASHAIVPFFGQGMNCGFEDCSVLASLLDQAGERPAWEPLFASFARARKPNCDAIADMALENFIEMRDKVADPRFRLEREVEKILQNRFPDEYVSRYGLVTFTRVPYRLALEAGVVENEILAELCAGLDRAEDVDLVRAQKLIREKLSHRLREANR